MAKESTYGPVREAFSTLLRLVGLEGHGPEHEVVRGTRHKFVLGNRITLVFVGLVILAQAMPGAGVVPLFAGGLFVYRCFVVARDHTPRETDTVVVKGGVIADTLEDSVGFSFLIEDEATAEDDVKAVCRAHAHLSKDCVFTFKRQRPAAWGGTKIELAFKDGDTEGAVEYEVSHQTPLPDSDA